MSTNNKFKVGDKVIRVQDAGAWLAIGQVCTVTKVADTGRVIQVDVTGGWYNAKNFEHYVEQSDVDSTAVLAPLKVFERILAGTPLEYRLKSSDHPTWYPLNNPAYVSLQSVAQCEFRVKPQTVEINGIDVPKPIDTVALDYPDKVYGINLSRHAVYYTTGHTNKGYFWSTEEDAQAVLDVILSSFSK